MTTTNTISPTLREPQLLGQTVVVIGGSSGIGLETARRVRDEGADVVITGRNPERLQQAARGVNSMHGAAPPLMRRTLIASSSSSTNCRRR